MVISIRKKIVKAYDELIELMFGPFGRWLGIYGFYCTLVVILYFILVSVVVFFHSLLGHRLGVIEDWTVQHGHHLIVFTKLVVGGGLMMLLNPVGDEGLLERLKRRFQAAPESPFLVVIIFLLVMMGVVLRDHGFSRPVSEHLILIHATSYFMSYFGTVIFYLVDALLLSFCVQLFPIGKLSWKQKGSLYLIVMVFCLLTTKLIFPHSREMVILTLHLLVMMAWLELRRGIGLDYLIYLGILAAPLSVIMGLDVVWGDLFSLFHAPTGLHLQQFGLLWSLAVVYLFWKNRHKFTI